MSEVPLEVDAFAKGARAFLAWCDRSHEGKAPGPFRHEALVTLSAIYNGALSLPGVEAMDAPEPPSMTSEKRSAISSNLLSLPFQYYWEVFTPSELDGDKEPVCGDLFDDFQDIYGDLACGLWLYDRGHVETAVFTWNLMFEVHWGRHAVSAMHALHSFDPDAADMRSNTSLELTREG
jgi:hypothetical protein